MAQFIRQLLARQRKEKIANCNVLFETLERFTDSPRFHFLRSFVSFCQQIACDALKIGEKLAA